MGPTESTDQAQASGAEAADEAGLWAAWRTGRDDAARRTLLDRHLPYARVIAALLYARRVHNDVDFDDYLQMARVGLLEAFDRYDPAAGAQFRTYASRRIRGAVLDGLERLTERHQQLALRRRMLADRTASMGSHDTADPDGPSTEHSAQAGGRHAPDLFQYLAEVGVGLAVGLMLDDTAMYRAVAEGTPGADMSYQPVRLRQTRHQLRDLIRDLPGPEQRVIRLHYEQGHPFEDIAREMGLTKGRISQIHKKAIASLRQLVAQRSPCDRAF